MPFVMFSAWEHWIHTGTFTNCFAIFDWLSPHEHRFVNVSVECGADDPELWYAGLPDVLHQFDLFKKL